MKNKKLWDKILNKEEVVKYSFSIGNGYIIFNLIFWGILSLVLIFLTKLGILVFLFTIFYFGFYLRIANYYAFTNKRIIIRTGWLTTQTTSIDYSKITDIHVREPFLERIITNSGSLAVNTAGSSNLEVFLNHVERPWAIKKILDDIRG